MTSKVVTAEDVEEARKFATYYHRDQKRKYTGEPYINHPAAVVKILQTVTSDNAVLAAAWLHDVVEDCNVPRTQLEWEFDEEVTALVMQVTDVSKPSDGNRVIRKKIDRTHLLSASARGKTIKLADMIDNTKSILEFDQGFAKIYIPEKRLLLDEALREGNQVLWQQADDIVRKALESWQTAAIKT